MQLHQVQQACMSLTAIHQQPRQHHALVELARSQGPVGDYVQVDPLQGMSQQHMQTLQVGTEGRNG